MGILGRENKDEEEIRLREERKRDIRELPAAKAARHGGLKKVGNTA